MYIQVSRQQCAYSLRCLNSSVWCDDGLAVCSLEQRKVRQREKIEKKKSRNNNARGVNSHRAKVDVEVAAAN